MMVRQSLRARAFVGVAVVAMVLTGLTACSVPAELELIGWLESQPIVEQVDNPPPNPFGSRNPVLVALDADATDSEFHDFVAGVGDILAKQEPSRQVVATVGKFEVLISNAEHEDSAPVADTVAELRADERVVSGFVLAGGVDLVVNRVDLAAVYDDYERDVGVVTVRTLEGDDSVELIGIVPCTEPALAVVASLMANPDIGGASLRACEDARVAAQSKDGVLALVDQLNPQVAGSGVQVTVVWDADPVQYFIAPEIEIPLDSLT